MERECIIGSGTCQTVGIKRYIGTIVTAAALAASMLLTGCAAQPSETAPSGPTEQAPNGRSPETTATATESPPETEPASSAQPSPNPAASQQRLMESALGFGSGFFQAVEEMGESGNPGFIPVLVDLMRFRYSRRQTEALAESLVKLAHVQESTEALPQHRNWDWWVIWLGENPQIKAVDGYDSWKGRLFGLTDEEMGELLYRGIPSRIRLEEVVWGGVPKDGIPDLEDPPVIPASEADYLNPRDRVFGVSFNGEHRAYPLRILNPHEMANDVVGGVPFALAY